MIIVPESASKLKGFLAASQPARGKDYTEFLSPLAHVLR